MAMNLPNLQIEPVIEPQSSMDMSESTLRFGEMSLSAQSLRVAGQSLTMEVTQADLVMGKRIGSGACSSVFVGTHRRTGECFAVKTFNVYDRDRKKQFEKELGVLLHFNCDCLVSFFGVSYHEGTVGLILEFMDCGSLDCIMDPRIHVTEPVLAAITYQILWGLCYLHHDHNIHRDLKPGNVLMNSNGEVKLSDFGIFRSLADTVATSETFTGTYKFMSPERLEGKSYNETADIWSLGVMVLQLWAKKYPFERGAFSPLELVDVLENTDMKTFTPPSIFPPGLAGFALTMLEVDPSKRIDAFSLIEHEWIRANNITSVDVAQEIVAGWIARAFPDRKPGHFTPPSLSSTHLESKWAKDEAGSGDESDRGGRGQSSKDTDESEVDYEDKRKTGIVAEGKFSDDEADSYSGHRGFK